MNTKALLRTAAVVAVTAGASTAMAATGTSDAATSMDGISTAFSDFLSGSGGALFAVIAVIIGIATVMLRPSIQAFGAMLVTGGLIGYGADAIKGFGSVTASIPAHLPVLADVAMALPQSF